MALAVVFDVVYTMKDDLENIIGKSVPPHMYSDSFSFFDIITKSFTTLEKRLMII